MTTAPGRTRVDAGAIRPQVLPTRQRRPGLIAAAVTAVVVFAALAGWLYSQAGEKTPVLVVAADVPQGHVISRQDLTTVEVSGSITAVTADRLSRVVGQVAAVHVLPGMLLQPSMLTTASPIAAGMAAVGIAVKGGQEPADGVSPGDLVAVVQVFAESNGTGAASNAQVLVSRARVLSARPDPAQAGGSLVTILVPQSELVSVAAAGGAGQVSLAEVPSP